MEDEDLVDRLRGGDREAYQALDERHRPILRRVFIRNGISPEDADDLVQETFIRFLTREGSPSRFNRELGRFGRWIRTVAERIRIDFLRRCGCRPVGGRPEGIEAMADNEPAPVEILEAREFSEDVGRCLEALSEEHRQSLMLELDELDLAAVAEALRIPPGTAGRRLFVARGRMRDCLEGKDYWFVPRDTPPLPEMVVILCFAEEKLVRVPLDRLEQHGYRVRPFGADNAERKHRPFRRAYRSVEESPDGCEHTRSESDA